MITDLKTLAGKGLRHITINNKDSLANFGVLITKDSITGSFESKDTSEDIPRRQGAIDDSVLNGVLYYKPRELRYTFKLAAADSVSFEDVRQQIYAWLDGAGKCHIADSNFISYSGNSATQWEFTNCVLKSIEETQAVKSIEVVFGYVTAVFMADPYLIKQGAVNARVAKFTDVIGTNESATIAVTDNDCTITKSDSTTQSVTLPNTTRKYRLVVYSANVPTVTMDGAALALDTVFTLPASATITIANAGYAYVELWNDTREVRL